MYILATGWIVTLDVLKSAVYNAVRAAMALNSNIRCIEIKQKMILHIKLSSWIVTLDVLKWA